LALIDRFLLLFSSAREVGIFPTEMPFLSIKMRAQGCEPAGWMTKLALHQMLSPVISLWHERRISNFIKTWLEHFSFHLDY
jgi:hypothetical protein